MNQHPFQKVLGPLPSPALVFSPVRCAIALNGTRFLLVWAGSKGSSLGYRLQKFASTWHRPPGCTDPLGCTGPDEHGRSQLQGPELVLGGRRRPGSVPRGFMQGMVGALRRLVKGARG